MKPRHPRPVRADNGVVVEFVGSMPGALFTDAGEAVPGRLPGIDELLTACPFRSVFARQWPVQIGRAWMVLPRDELLPVPLFIIEAIIEEVQAGRAFLLLSSDRRTRDRAKAAITAMLTSRGGHA
jgi:hypothetical protein